MPDIYTPEEMLAKLVSFPTVSRESNVDLMDFVADYLAGHGVEAHRTWSADGQKCNIYACVGPHEEGGVVLSGHVDVVPVDGQDSYTGSEANGVESRDYTEWSGSFEFVEAASDEGSTDAKAD